MEPTDTSNPDYFHRVVDCQWACPAHTDVPEYIRLIAQGEFTAAYMVNRESNVFPGILGRVCDRPCEPACRRGRIEEKPVAICRLKRVAADHRDDVSARLPKVPKLKNGKKVALVGAGCASLTVANMRGLLQRGGYDAVFVGSGAPKGKELSLPGRQEGAANIHIGIAWLESVAFGHTEKIGRRVLIIGVGNTAMDCCRTSLRLGAENVKVMARKPRGFFKASIWELEDAEEESVQIVINRAPKAFVIENGKLAGMLFDQMEYDVDAQGRITAERIAGEEFLAADDVILAIGQENSFPWVERDLGIQFDKWDVPLADKVTFQSTRAEVFFGGDAAFGPKNIIWAVEHGHQAAISIHRFCQGEAVEERLAPGMSLASRKMGMHEWSYANDYTPVERRLMPHVSLKERFKKLNIEVELGFTAEQVQQEVQRCLNCDVQTVFSAKLCIECDACIDICPVDCLTITHNGAEDELRTRLKAPAKNLTQLLYVSAGLPQTGRVMVKDEDLCVHCGLCAERCPTAAWDMQKSSLHWPHAVDAAKILEARKPKIA